VVVFARDDFLKRKKPMSKDMIRSATWKIKRTKRLNNSRNGNPKFKFIFENGTEMVTPTDAGWIYGLTPHTLHGKEVTIQFKIIRNGYELQDIKEIGK
tara:strand:- start:1192 stop:1485 length:294 start_codon:yes stop_codon:yes gene_type:complete